LNLLFLSLMILIVYLGALIVLFLFVVMMLNIKSLELNRVINFFPFIFIFASAFFLIFLSNGFNFFTMNTNLTLFLFYSFEWQSLYYLTGLFFSIGFYLYTFGSVFLVLISIILLLAMFGAIILTLTPFKHFLKQNSVDQLFQLRYLENINFKL